MFLASRFRSAWWRMSVWAAGLSLFTLCLSLGETPFTLNVTQDVYQAEEHGNTTLTWLFPVKPDTHSLYIDIMYVRPERRIYLYDSEHELELYPHELYRGRVWCDLELAKKGRIECLFTDLKLNDTGTYQVLVIIDEYHDYKTCDLNVTVEDPAARSPNKSV
ncbi:uncharacterized protein AKAME5_001939200 [Lates japonicus]|uniref:Uncharacterized protein n=1 Tax=Lates japonicus TaxID=270547 RepID=A0AAD3NB67_LATJO|nr:uncharacterized protein AKAME5_001939200 [Lates japonicus]